MRLNIWVLFLTAVIQVQAKDSSKGPFLQTLGPQEHIIGNDIWNVTIGPIYGTKLFYKNKDLVGNAVGHYVSYSLFPTFY
jgi:hypothetical protein